MIHEIVKAYIITFQDLEQTKAYIHWKNRDGELGFAEGSPYNLQIRALLIRARIQGVPVPHHVWGAPKPQPERAKWLLISKGQKTLLNESSKVAAQEAVRRWDGPTADLGYIVDSEGNMRLSQLSPKGQKWMISQLSHEDEVTFSNNNGLVVLVAAERDGLKLQAISP